MTETAQRGGGRDEEAPGEPQHGGQATGEEPGPGSADRGGAQGLAREVLWNALLLPHHLWEARMAPGGRGGLP